MCHEILRGLCDALLFIFFRSSDGGRTAGVIQEQSSAQMIGREEDKETKEPGLRPDIH